MAAGEPVLGVDVSFPFFCECETELAFVSWGGLWRVSGCVASADRPGRVALFNQRQRSPLTWTLVFALILSGKLFNAHS